MKTPTVEEFTEMMMSEAPSSKHRDECLRGMRCEGENCPLCCARIRVSNAFTRLALNGLDVEAHLRECNIDLQW